MVGVDLRWWRVVEGEVAGTNERGTREGFLYSAAAQWGCKTIARPSRESSHKQLWMPRELQNKPTSEWFGGIECLILQSSSISSAIARRTGVAGGEIGAGWRVVAAFVVDLPLSTTRKHESRESQLDC